MLQYIGKFQLQIPQQKLDDIELAHAGLPPCAWIISVMDIDVLDVFLYLSPFTISIYLFHSIESKSLLSVLTFSYSIENNFPNLTRVENIAQSC